MKDEIILKTKEYAINMMRKNDSAHDHLHVIRVFNLANQLASHYPECNAFYVQMIALLHDLEDYKLETARVTNVKEYLDAMDFLSEEKEFILKGIDLISFSKNPQKIDSIPLEVKIVQDADRLDAIGAVGVARTFAYGSAHGHPFYSDNPTDKTTLAHFHEKLFHLHERMYTKEAKEIAEKRTAFLEDFYETFCMEVGIKKEGE